MKKLLCALLAVSFTSLAATAQTKPLESVKISTPSVQCEMCKKRIEQYLKRIDGVTYVNVAVRKKETAVKYLTDRTNIEMIKTSIANAGYDVAKPKTDPAAAPQYKAPSHKRLQSPTDKRHDSRNTGMGKAYFSP